MWSSVNKIIKSQHKTLTKSEDEDEPEEAATSSPEATEEEVTGTEAV
jgi:hypothetical protein